MEHFNDEILNNRYYKDIATSKKIDNIFDINNEKRFLVGKFHYCSGLYRKDNKKYGLLYIDYYQESDYLLFTADIEYDAFILQNIIINERIDIDYFYMCAYVTLNKSNSRCLMNNNFIQSDAYLY